MTPLPKPSDPWFAAFLITTLASVIMLTAMLFQSERVALFETEISKLAVEAGNTKAGYENAKWLMNKSAAEFLRLYAASGCEVYRSGPLPYPQRVESDGHAGLAYSAWETICTAKNGTPPTYSWVYLPLDWWSDASAILWNRSP